MLFSCVVAQNIKQHSGEFSVAGEEEVAGALALQAEGFCLAA